ncbi:hypothetical protein CTAYLR_007018 [Chrysophaeum taylorii]|uniref:SPX domain-containing protein n=1 Tax=Chrysophaeum taylorii TaxID=2483200 RepID=A0AAD7U7R6_9STRA|nr:hypothetical protein CTAYLR_007018 [Chrysophaeum taylorii]
MDLLDGDVVRSVYAFTSLRGAVRLAATSRRLLEACPDDHLGDHRPSPASAVPATAASRGLLERCEQAGNATFAARPLWARLARQRAKVATVTEALAAGEVSLAEYAASLWVLGRELDDDVVADLARGGPLVVLCVLHAAWKCANVPRLFFFLFDEARDARVELCFYERGFLDPNAPLRSRDYLRRETIYLDHVIRDFLRHMVQFGAILEESKVSFDETFRSHFVDYEELKRVLERPGVTSVAFERALDGEIEKSALFACGRVGHVAEVLREGGDVAAAREATSLLLATLRFVELNLVAVRKIVKKRDKFAARDGFGRAPARKSGGVNWLLCPERSRHLECLESFEPQFAALLVSARAIRESRVFGGARGPPALNVAAIPADRPSPRPGALDRKGSHNSMMGALIATGDAADARALAELIDSCEQALASAHAARRDLRLHAAAAKAAMSALGGVDSDVDYAKTSSRDAADPPLSRSKTRTRTRTPAPAPTTSARPPTASGGGGEQPKPPPPLVKGDHCCERLAAAASRAWRRHRPSKGYYAAVPPPALEEGLGGEHCAACAAAARRVALAAQCSGAALYAASCYAIAPTAHDYAARVNAPRAFAGVLLAAAPLASLASRFAMSEWCRRARVGFKPPVILGGALCCAGNLLYCVAPRLVLVRHRAPLALFARVAVGASGGADAVNRRYIGTADLPPSDRGAAAARYVAADALGVALGPLLAAACAARGRRSLAALTAPSLGLAVAWALHALFVAALWREIDPTCSTSSSSESARGSPSNDNSSSGSRTTARDPLDDSFEKVPSSYGTTEARPRQQQQAFPYQSALGRLFASGVVHEAILASSALVSDDEFGWTPRSSGLLLCCLRLSALASTRRAEDLAERFDERALSVCGSAGTLVATVVLLAFPMRSVLPRGALTAWLLASFAAFACAEVMGVADKALVAKLKASAARKRAPIVAIGARVCGDLVFALAATRTSVRAIVLVLWLPPAISLLAALASVLLVVDRAYRAANDGPS